MTQFFFWLNNVKHFKKCVILPLHLLNSLLLKSQMHLLQQEMRTFELRDQVCSEIHAVKRDIFTLFLLTCLGLPSPVLEKGDKNQYLVKKFPKVTNKIGEPIITCKKIIVYGVLEDWVFTTLFPN